MKVSESTKDRKGSACFFMDEQRTFLITFKTEWGEIQMVVEASDLREAQERSEKLLNKHEELLEIKKIRDFAHA
jgi:hypothetical protein